MPGVACALPPMISTDADSVFIGNACLGSPWEPRNLGHFNHSRIPLLVPLKHKACRPNNLSSAPWLIAKPSSKQQQQQQQSFISSNDSENDLAAMVHDFIENGSSPPDGYESRSDKTEPGNFAAFLDDLKALVAPSRLAEKRLRSSVRGALRSLSEGMDLVCNDECNGRCIRYALVKRLLAAGYDAGVCVSRWVSAGRVPGGQYEYIDVNINEEQYIIDLDFQSHFEIARPVASYLAALKLLPAVFVGSSKKLRSVLEAMSSAARSSLKQSSMHLPPWRTLEYMRAKWFSDQRRVEQELPRLLDEHNVKNTKNKKRGCPEHLKRIKAAARRTQY